MDNDDQSNSKTKLFVGNLNYRITKEDLNSLFRPYGEIQEIKIIDKGRFVYAFVQYTQQGDAEEAYRELQGQEIKSTNMKIEYATGRKNEKSDFQPRNQRTGNSDRLECYQCGSKNHLKRDCPELKRRSRSRDKHKHKKKKS